MRDIRADMEQIKLLKTQNGTLRKEKGTAWRVALARRSVRTEPGVAESAVAQGLLEGLWNVCQNVARTSIRGLLFRFAIASQEMNLR